MTDADQQSRTLAGVLGAKPRYGMYAISAPSPNGSRTVRAYCARCNRQDAVYVITRSGRVTEKPGDGSKRDPEESVE